MFVNREGARGRKCKTVLWNTDTVEIEVGDVAELFQIRRWLIWLWVSTSDIHIQLEPNLPSDLDLEGLVRS